jgi:hypothetical protein
MIAPNSPNGVRVVPKFLYRIRLIHVESTSAKSRQKNLGELSSFETDSKRTAEHEIARLKEMIDRPSWQVQSQIVAERSEISDFVGVHLDTLEPAEPFPGRSQTQEQAESGNQTGE